MAGYVPVGIDSNGFLPPEARKAVTGGKLQATAPEYGGLKPWVGGSAPIVDSWPALQAAQLAARIAKTELEIPGGIYYVSRTYNITSTTGQTTSAHKISGVGTMGSILDPTGKAGVEIRPLPDDRWVGDPTDPVVRIIGFGIEIEGICINGMGLAHDLWDVEQGIELRMTRVRAMDTTGHGFILNCVCNALLMTLHADTCGSYQGKAAVRVGTSPVYGITNTFTALNWHLERSPGVHLDIASGSNASTDRTEFADYIGLHIEKLIDNTSLTEFTDDPVIRIGNARGQRFLGGTIAGGKGPLVSVERQIATNAVGDPYKGILFSGMEFLGYAPYGSTAPNNVAANVTPARLIDLVTGDGVKFTGCDFNAAIVELVRIQSTFGPSVFLDGTNDFIRDRPGTTSAATITDDRPTTLAGRARAWFGATFGIHARGDRPGIFGGGSSPGLSIWTGGVAAGAKGVFSIVDNETDSNAQWQFDTNNKRQVYATGQAPGANPTGGVIYEWLDPTRNKLTTRDSSGVVSEGQQTLLGSAVWDPPSIAAGSYVSYVQPVANAAMGMPVVVAPTVDPGDGVDVRGVVSTTGNVRITIYNRTASAVDLGSQTFTIKVLR